ncbi:ATP-binding protein [Crossiella cryophila]|uniref:Tetratricopeptide (TPR) repeat protein n=1 Tax=Crossiella cryophila TaxID=43355 RepID=A0A7W7CIZ0_9PSEU|nr:tetratricopeptide repeat protein [Crossiella cryophila]MBB4680613.1 tetratricopeptide (TPR) repeat protein [Crossiella cryophila]
MSHNEMSGAVLGSLLQARDVTVRLPPPAPRALDGLPARAGTFTGRAEDLAALGRILDPGEGPRACVVTGLPGVGKTELALQAAEQAHRRGWCSGGVLFLDLHGYHDRALRAADALDSLLRALGVPADQIPPEPADRTRLYATLLATQARAGHPVLVVLDNAGSAEQVRPLLPADGHTPVLITSRHRLSDLDARLHELDVLPTAAGAELLDRILRTRHQPDDRAKADPAAATRIATLCGGLPLAIQIAGALLADNRTRPAHTLAADLAEGPIDELTREGQGVRRAFDLSYRHLSPDQRRVFRLLTAHPGPDLSTDLAQPLLATTPRHTRRALESLARAHLLEPGSTYGRWRMHDLIRDYATEHGQSCAAADDREAAIDRLLEHLHTKASAAAGLLSTARMDQTVFPGRPEAADWIEAERDNLVACTELAADSGRHPRAMFLSAAVSYCLLKSSHPWSCYRATQAGLISAKEIGDLEIQAVLHSRAGDALRRTGRLTAAAIAQVCSFGAYGELGLRGGQAHALDELGVLSTRNRQFDQAIHLHTSAIKLFQDLGDTTHEALAWCHLGTVQHQQRRCDQAIATYEHALELSRTTANHQVEDQISTAIGECLLMSGHPAKALEIYQHTAGQLAGQNTRDEHFLSQGNLAHALAAAGKPKQAIAIHEQCVAHWTNSGDRERERIARFAHGVALYQDDRWAEAVTALRELAGQAESAGDRLRQAGAWQAIGDSQSALARHEDALAAYVTSADLHQSRGDHYFHAVVLAKQAHELDHLDRPAESLTAATTALTLFQRHGAPRDQRLAHRLAGIALQELARFPEARTHFEQEITLCRNENNRYAEAWAQGRLAFTLHSLNLPEEAGQARDTAVALFTELGHPNHAQSTLDLLGAPDA